MDVESEVRDGHRFSAPLDHISMPPAPQHQPTMFDLTGAGDDAFGAPSREDLDAMERLSQAAPQPDAVPGSGRHSAAASGSTGAGAPPIEEFLAGSVRRDSAGLGRPSLGLYGSEAGGLSTDHGLPGLGGSPLDRLRSPLPVRRTLSYGSASEGPGGAGAAFSHFLDDASPVPVARSPSAFPAAAAAVGTEPATPERLPPPKRQRKAKAMFDEVTEISREQYHDCSKITKAKLCEYSLFLPHRSAEMSLTTSFSDLVPELCELFLRAPGVGEKRRLDQAQAMHAAKRAALLAIQEVDEAAVAAALQSPAASTPVARPSPEPRRIPGLSPSAASSHGFGSPAPASHDPSPAPSLAPMSRSAHARLDDEGVGVPWAGSPGQAPLDASPAHIDLGVSAALGGSSASPAGLAGLPASEPVKEEPVDMEVASQGLSSLAKQQGQEIQNLLADAGPDESISFFGLCEQQPPGGAHAAARRFANLMALHMKAAVDLVQEEPFGDISIAQGPSFTATVLAASGESASEDVAS